MWTDIRNKMNDSVFYRWLARSYFWEGSVVVIQLLSSVPLFVTPWSLQHARLPCPSLSSRVCSNSCPLSQWYFLIIPSSAVRSPLPSIFPRIRVFSNESVLPLRWQSTGASDLAIVLPMCTQSWFPLGFTGLNSLQSKGLSRVFFNTTVQKHQFFSAQPSLWFNSHIHT